MDSLEPDWVLRLLKEDIKGDLQSIKIQKVTPDCRETQLKPYTMFDIEFQEKKKDVDKLIRSR